MHGGKVQVIGRGDRISLWLFYSGDSVGDSVGDSTGDSVASPPSAGVSSVVGVFWQAPKLAPKANTNSKLSNFLVIHSPLGKDWVRLGDLARGSLHPTAGAELG